MTSPIEIGALLSRLNDLEDKHNTLSLGMQRQIEHLLERIEALEDSIPEVNEPEHRNTDWHPHDVLASTWCPVMEDERVSVLMRNGEMTPVQHAGECDWDDQGECTIVAWRYTKEGE